MEAANTCTSKDFNDCYLPFSIWHAHWFGMILCKYFAKESKCHYTTHKLQQSDKLNNPFRLMIFDYTKKTVCSEAFFYEYDSIIILWTTCLGLSLQHTRNQFQLFPPRASVNQPSLLSFTKYAGKKSTRHWRDKNVKALTNKEIFLMSSVMGFPISLE